MTSAAILDSYRDGPLVLGELVDGEDWLNIGGFYRLEVQAITPGHEAMYGIQWLKATLAADATLAGFAPGGVWLINAPPGTVPPFVVIVYQAGTDTLTMNAVRIFTRPMYQVKAVGPAGMTSQLVSAASRLDQLIGNPPTGGTV